jgi:hypothetical protein
MLQQPIAASVQGKERSTDYWALEILKKRAFELNKKITDHRCLSTHTSVFSYPYEISLGSP